MSHFNVVNPLQNADNALFIQGIPVGSGIPTDGQILTYNGATRQWVLTTQSISNKVDKSGDTMTGDLFLSIASDVTRQLGCNDLGAGETFRLLMGNATNAFIEYAETTGLLEYRGRSSAGFRPFPVNAANLIVNDTEVILTRPLSISTNVVASLGDPIANTDGANKDYTDTTVVNTVSVTASSRGGLTVNRYQFSFGSGEAGTFDTGPIGWTAFRDGEITDLSIAGEQFAGSLMPAVTVALSINNVEQASYTVTKGASVFSATTSFGTPLAFSAGDNINFRSKTTQGSGSNQVIVSFLARI